MSDTYTKLFSSITESTVWGEPYATRIVWVAMLAMADAKGNVYGAVPGLARRANVTLQEVETALKSFREPDPYSRTKDADGRRIEDIDGGWRLINHAKYGAVRNAEERRAYKREWDRKNRGKAAQGSESSDTQSDESDTNPTEPTGATPPTPTPTPEDPPIPPQGGLLSDEDGKPKRKRAATGKITFAMFVAECREAGEKPIPADHAVFGFARDTGIPVEFIRLAWREFARKYREETTTQKGRGGWRKKFDNCVRGNWYRLWWLNPEGTCELTTTGRILQKELEAEAREAA